MFFIPEGFHGLHVIGGLIAFILFLARTTLGKFTPAQATAAIVVSYYWHFVDVVWIGLFSVIYTDPLTSPRRTFVTDDDYDVDAELGFEPAVSATGAEPRPRRSRPDEPRMRKRPQPAPAHQRRRSCCSPRSLGMGAAYASLATSSGAAASATDQVAHGRQLYKSAASPATARICRASRTAARH